MWALCYKGGWRCWQEGDANVSALHLLGGGALHNVLPGHGGIESRNEGRTSAGLAMRWVRSTQGAAQGPQMERGGSYGERGAIVQPLHVGAGATWRCE